MSLLPPLLAYTLATDILLRNITPTVLGVNCQAIGWPLGIDCEEQTLRHVGIIIIGANQVVP